MTVTFGPRQLQEEIPSSIPLRLQTGIIKKFSIPVDLFIKAAESAFRCNLFYLTNQKDIGSVTTFLLSDCHHSELYVTMATLFVRIFGREGDEYWYEMRNRTWVNELEATLENKHWDTAPVSRKGANNSFIIATELLKTFKECSDEDLPTLDIYFKFLKINMETDEHFKSHPNCDQLRTLPIFNASLTIPKQDLRKLYTFKIFLFCNLVRDQINHLINSTRRVRQKTLNQSLIQQNPNKKGFYSAGLEHFVIKRNIEPIIKPTLQNKAFIIIAVNIDFVYNKTLQDDVKMAKESSTNHNTLPYLHVAFREQHQLFLDQNMAILKELGL